MARIWGSVAFRLALGYGVLVVGSMAVILAIFYAATLGVLARDTDAQLTALANQFMAEFRADGADGLRRMILDRLGDNSGDEDTEVYLLTAPDGRPIAGNISGWKPASTPFERLTDQPVTRAGRPSVSRLLPHRLANGDILVVGRDMRDRREIEALVSRALVGGGIFTLFLAILGALLFRRRLERQIAAIRRTALDIEAGDLSRRIPVSSIGDEFARLGRDINHMLDRIEHLMDGVRHVSNAIAHDLRTPLGRLRGQLDGALRPGARRGALSAAARGAIAQIDELTGVFDRLLQIAEAEAGARRQSFAPVALADVVADVVELYDAAAEARGIALSTEIDPAAAILGDRHLMASAVANLLDNALKYAGDGAKVRIAVHREEENVALTVADNGPGVPAAERARIVERFYRLDRSRSLPGNGLGLSIVSAVSALHGGKLSLEDAAPGLSARIVLPRAEEGLLAEASGPQPARLAITG
ncbi:MAG TPA: HAMP domain-containing sensor histidine kinase [Stellaceae bacterium]|nr:HAMP domain-containing sensor histidine kinase [Stellaceae bacterium]